MPRQVIQACAMVFCAGVLVTTGPALFSTIIPEAQAGLFDDDKARADIAKLREDLEQVRRQTEQTTRNQLDFTGNVDALRAEVARLRGQIEVLTNKQETALQRQNDFYVDLDNRLRQLETKTTSSNMPAPDKSAAATADDLTRFESALARFKAGNYKDALTAFQGFIKEYPQSDLQAAAYFWAASAYVQLRDYNSAAASYNTVATRWPQDSRAPDALLGRADALNSSGKTKLAQQVLEQLIRLYPQSAAATTAKSRLAAKKR